MFVEVANVYNGKSEMIGGDTEMESDLIEIFEQANNNLLSKDIELFKIKVSERTLCGALMLHLHDVIKDTHYKEYFVDVEYNRNKGGKLVTRLKTIKGPDEKTIKINCDLIVHSRGQNMVQDNLIAIEMKKSSRPQDKKDKDRERIITLTKESFDDVWPYDEKTLPHHVCRYKLGIYYEINYATNNVLLEYYIRGNLFDTKYKDLRL